MTHIDEHTLELYVLNAAEVDERREEIQKHIAECHGCKALVDEMIEFHSELVGEIQNKPEELPSPETAIVRSPRAIEPFYEPDYQPMQYMPRTPMQRFRYFVRQHPVATTAGSFGLAALLAGMVYLFTPNQSTNAAPITDRNPAFKNYNTKLELLEIYNKNYEQLWKMIVPRIEEESRDKTVVGDLDGDGNNEVITTLQPLGSDPSLSQALRIYDGDGNMLKEISFNRHVAYRDRQYESLFNANTIVIGDIDKDGEQEMYVTSSGFSRSPSILFKMNSKGSIIGEYWHFGVMSSVYHADIDGDGREEIILAGQNDTRDSIDMNRNYPVFTILDPRKITGKKKSTACLGFDLEPSDAEIYYIQFPLTDYNDARIIGAAVNRIHTEDSNFVQAHVVGPVDFSFDYYMDRQLTVLDVKSNNKTDRTYKEAVDRRIVKGKLDNAYRDNLKHGVRYWDGRKWQEKVVKVQHQQGPP